MNLEKTTKTLSQKQLFFLALFCLLLTQIFFLWTGIRGVDFGPHFDEHRILRTVSRVFSTGTLLPQEYYYPSLSFDLALLMLTPEWILFLKEHFQQWKPPGPEESEDIASNQLTQHYQNFTSKEPIDRIVKFIDSHAFSLRLRTLYILLTSFTGWWIFFALYNFRRKIFESMIGGILVLSSWEVAYHSRWAMPDTLQLQFAALTLMCVSYAFNKTEKSFQWLVLGTIAAAFNCASKYHGGVFLLMTCFTTFYLDKKQALPRLVIFKKMVQLVAIFSFSFFLLCPGILLQPLHFFDDVSSRIVNYSLGHGGYTVQPLWEHGWLLILYLSQSLCSSSAPVALFFFLFSFFGVFTSWKNTPSNTLLLLSASFIFFFYIITNKVMIVRNDLQLIPILVFFIAIGVGEVQEKISKRLLQRSFEILLGVLLSFNFFWLYYTSETIARRSEINFVYDIANHLKTHSNQKFFLSVLVSKKLKTHFPSLQKDFPNVVTSSQKADSYLFFSGDVLGVHKMNWVKLRANRQQVYQLVGGTYDVNLDYYPTWGGSSKLIVFPLAQALEMGILPP